MRLPLLPSAPAAATSAVGAPQPDRPALPTRLALVVGRGKRPGTPARPDCDSEPLTATRVAPTNRNFAPGEMARRHARLRAPRASFPGSSPTWPADYRACDGRRRRASAARGPDRTGTTGVTVGR